MPTSDRIQTQLAALIAQHPDSANMPWHLHAAAATTPEERNFYSKTFAKSDRFRALLKYHGTSPGGLREAIADYAALKGIPPRWRKGPAADTLLKYMIIRESDAEHHAEYMSAVDMNQLKNRVKVLTQRAPWTPSVLDAILAHDSDGEHAMREHHIQTSGRFGKLARYHLHYSDGKRRTLVEYAALKGGVPPSLRHLPDGLELHAELMRHKPAAEKHLKFFERR